MNLLQGVLMDNKQAAAAMAGLPERIAATLEKPPLAPDVVVSACDALATGLPEADVLPVLAALGFAPQEAKRQLAGLRLMFSRPYLEARLETELGPGYGTPAARKPLGLARQVTEQLYPLGVLFHIAAGNMDGLPVYTVIEGLLAGNINLLKLPAVDGGLSVLLLQRLFEIEPALAEYVYVFELSSTETESLQQLAALANAVVVWGGDETVQAVRQMAPPNVKIIEWGHKLSFAYVTPAGMGKAALAGLAGNICATNQLLCSSCQGIYVDGDEADARRFCEAFLPVLESEAARHPAVPLAPRAQNTLQLYTQRLEGVYGHRASQYRGRGVCLLLEAGEELTPSLQFRNPWVKCLPRQRLARRLHPYKNTLQTAALLCGRQEWEPLKNLLWQAGVVRVSSGAEMSETYCGAAHDGEYPLRRYTRVVSAQK